MSHPSYVTLDTVQQISADLSKFKLSVDNKLNAISQRISNVEKSVVSLEKCFGDYVKKQEIMLMIEKDE